MTHAERTAAALALAQEATDITGTIYVAEIDYSGAERFPTFAVLDSRGGFIVSDLVEEDVIADVVEHLDLAADVAADPESYHPDTRAAFGVETEADRADRQAAEEQAWLDEIAVERESEIAAMREREAWSERATARDEALYGPSEPIF